jgi:BirA family transcriptional regulator, biotin operon repressor / biotin---[acetyl-CoA-carboxylase] ligase
MARPELPPGYRHEGHHSLPSTSSVALERARAGAASGLWITAGEQTRGRGRRGRTWTTEPGNLAASLLLIDPASPPLAATVSFVAGLALHQAILDLAGPGCVDRLKLKWPNDLLLDQRKVAGILVEGEKLPDGGFAVVIGIGANCRSHPEGATVYPATDLLSAGVAIEATALFERLALNFAAELRRWDRGKGFAAVRAAWLERAIGVGEAITVNLPDRAVAGRFDSLDGDGRLVLALPDGARETISAGDLFFARAG